MTSIVISLLKALMRDQVKALQKKWVQGAAIMKDTPAKDISGNVQVLKCSL